VDRESAYEKLKGRADQPVRASAGSAQMGQAAQPAGKPWYENLPSIGLPNLGGSTRGGRRGDSLMDAVMKSAVRIMGSRVGRQLVRAVLGSLLGGSVVKEGSADFAG
jgi:uncharacterized protein